jgi:hypothetical protein
LGDDDHLCVGDVRIGFDFELRECPEASGDQRQSDQDGDEPLAEGES